MVTGNITRYETAAVNGATLEYRDSGEGEPVLFVHGAIVGDAFHPLLSRPELAGYRLVTYHRRGYCGSSRSWGPVSLHKQAADAVALLDHLGIQRAHVVGHSAGGSVALQLAMTAPERVHTLALLEPSILSVRSAPAFEEAMQPIAGNYQARKLAETVDGFCRLVAGPRFREMGDANLPPGWFEQAVADIDTFFQVELPALAEWQFTGEHAARIRQPILSVLGEESAAVDPTTEEVHELLRDWLPQTETLTVPEATHALQIFNPAGLAGGLTRFFARHPVA